MSEDVVAKETATTEPTTGPSPTGASAATFTAATTASSTSASADVAFNDGLGPRILHWLFTDVIWATLPLCVLGMISYLAVNTSPPSGFTSRPFWVQPEWSFASITLLAACLREMLRVKMEVEKANFRSASAVVGAIVAAIVLNTVLMGFIYAERLGATFSLGNVALFQQVFFIGSLVLTLSIFFFEWQPWVTTENDKMWRKIEMVGAEVQRREALERRSHRRR